MHAAHSVVERDPARDPAHVLPGSEFSVVKYSDVVLSLFEKSGIGLAVLDPALRVRAVNDMFSEQCGRSRDAVMDHSFLTLVPVSMRNDLLRHFERLIWSRPARAVHPSLAVRFEGSDTAGRLAVFPVDAGTGKVRMIAVQFTPERLDESLLAVREQRKLTALTARILEGVAAGDPTVRLAAKLFLSRQGIEYHVSILLRQFQVPNRTALAAKAYSMGIFSIGCWPPRVLPEHIRD